MKDYQTSSWTSLTTQRFLLRIFQRHSLFHQGTKGERFVQRIHVWHLSEKNYVLEILLEEIVEPLEMLM